VRYYPKPLGKVGLSVLFLLSGNVSSVASQLESYVPVGDKSVEVVVSNHSSQSRLDFELKRGAEVVNLNFQVLNKHATEVSITDISTSCGCMANESTTSSIPSGEVRDFTIRFSAPPPAGTIGKSVTIHYQISETVARTHQIDLYVKIPRRFEAIPNAVKFKRNDESGPVAVKIGSLLDVDHGREIELRSSRGVVSVRSLSRSGADEWAAVLEVRSLSSLVADQVDRLELVDVDSRKVLFSMPFYVSVARTFDVRPKDVFATRADDGSYRSRLFFTIPDSETREMKVSTSDAKAVARLESVSKAANGMLGYVSVENWDESQSSVDVSFGYEEDGASPVVVTVRRRSE
jgi:hypothetical protein